MSSDGPAALHLLHDTPATEADTEIVARITAICEEFEAYGYRRVGAELRHQGIVVNSKKIRRLMRQHDLFQSGRQLSAWLGLVPRQHSSGGKDRLGRISKRGDGYIRRLLVHGARTVLRWRRAKPGASPGWTDQLLARRPTNVVLVAVANKTARVAWALLRYERIYQPAPG